MFLNSVRIQNYKCFGDKTITLSKPDGSRGSGLNILIGENGNGKTAALEAINYLTAGSYTAENRLQISDFKDFEKPILIEGETDPFTCSSSIDFFRTFSFQSNGIEFVAKSRSAKERNKVLSTPFDVSTRFRVTDDKYVKQDGSSPSNTAGTPKSIDGRDRLFSVSRIVGEEGFNIFYFDKNRSRQLNTGTFKTTFERICDDLNWKFVKSLYDSAPRTAFTAAIEVFTKEISDIVKNKVGTKTIGQLKDFFEDASMSDVGVELIDLLHPFSGAFFASREGQSLTQIRTKDLGSGVEMILVFILLSNISGAAKGNIVYLIDEPELHLHPKAQEKLLELLLEESKSKQVVMSTHSPYMFRKAVAEEATLLLFGRDQGTKSIVVERSTEIDVVLKAAQRPSWGAINYYVFDLPSIDFHDELYGFLHDRYIRSATTPEESERRGKLTSFEREYLQKRTPVCREWTPEFGGVAKEAERVTLPTFIRHKTHHPENQTMQSVTFCDEELRSSIKQLIGMVRQDNPAG